MKAEDTVMSWDDATKDKELTQEETFHCEQLATIGVNPSDESADREFEANYKGAVDAMQRYLTAQVRAGISFKAGIKEVVKWVSGHRKFVSLLTPTGWQIEIGIDEWQAQLKEWGINE